MARPAKTRQILLLAAALLPARAAAPAEPPRNLLLVTLDTFRGDRLGANGGGREATPNLDALAAAGANFSRARSPVPLTLPAHASILTGAYPRTHGVRVNGDVLGSELPTLAETLAERGFATAAFVGSFVLDHRFGLARGFASYDDRVTTDPTRLESVEAERDGALVVAAFESWLAAAAAGERPFFAWLHLYDPHAPYAAPEPWRGRWARDPYGGEIAYTDALVGRALAALAARGLERETLVAVVGDHGEGLGEHGESTHALLIYNSTLHVPMLLWAPGRVPPARVPDLVRTIDLAPTLLDTLGLPAELGEGVSLRPLIARRAGGVSEKGGTSNGGTSNGGIARRAGAREKGGTSGAEEKALAALGESLYAWRRLGWSPLEAIEEGRYRYIRAPEPELYDLARDPGETRNLVAAAPDVARRLARRLEALVGSAGRGAEPPPEPAIDAETAARLRSLGYLSAAAPSASPEVDPKSRIALWERLQLALARAGRGEPAEAARELESILRAAPEIPLVWESLGAAYARLGRAEAAERVYAEAFGRGFESANMRIELGQIQAGRGAWERAEEELRRALVLDPTSVVARYRLAEVHRSAGRPAQAVAELEAALAINPAYVYAWNALGLARSAAGRGEEALAAFRRAVELAPEEPRGVLNLAVQLERMGRAAEAVAAWRRCLELAERDGPPEARRMAAEALERLAVPR